MLMGFVSRFPPSTGLDLADVVLTEMVLMLPPYVMKYGSYSVVFKVCEFRTLNLYACI